METPRDYPAEAHGQPDAPDGQPAARDGQPAAACPPPAPPNGQTLTWEYPIPLITSRFMLRDLAMVIVLSVIIMQLILLVTGFLVSGELLVLPPMVYAIVTGVMAALFLIACLLMGNRYDMGFRVEPQGVTFYTGARQAKRNRVWRTLGVMSGNATAAGSAILAASQDEGSVPWRDIHKVTVHPGPRVITLSNSWRPVLRLYCHREDYRLIEGAVLARFQAAEMGRTRVAARKAATAAPGSLMSNAQAFRAGLVRIVVWTLASIAATLAALAWYEPLYDDQWRLVVLAGVVVWTAGLFRVSPLRRILGLGALALSLYLAVLLGAEAFDPIVGPSGASYGRSFESETRFLIVAALGHLALIGMSCWRLFGRAPAEQQPRIQTEETG